MGALATSFGMGGLRLDTHGSPAGGPTSTKTLLARSRSGATPVKHGNGHLQVRKRLATVYQCYPKPIDGPPIGIGFARSRTQIDV
jgi:hypothetical protein